MKKARPTTASAATIRVGIYCRQSVASDLEFGSIQAQREAVEAFVVSQRGEGWVALPERYDDHGFSGGNTDRPAFQRLVADIQAGKVDVLAAYKIDRVSRSLTDFTQFMTTLERHGVGFVSTTQSFDTRTSMGRLTLNILASFSQFERETIAERTRDKVAATRRKGMFTGGKPILGYDVRDKQLVVNRAEADVVRDIFRTYLEHGGLVATVAELERRGVRNKSWTNKASKQVHGRPFDKNTLRALLTNPLVVGRIRCGDDVVEARHNAIIDDATFDAVARTLKDHRRPYRAAVGKHGALLGGILRCARCGAAMTPAANIRGPRVHRYYVCSTAMKQGTAACPGSRAPAAGLEDVVVARIRAIGTDPSVLTATLTAAQQARHAQEPGLVAEHRRITNDRTQLTEQRRNLLDALQHGGGAANVIAGRIAEVDAQIGRLQARDDDVTAQLAALQTDVVDEGEVRAALQQFTGMWSELIPRERARVLRLLISEVRYDGQAGEVRIEFRDNGLRSLAHEATARRPA